MTMHDDADADADPQWTNTPWFSLTTTSMYAEGYLPVGGGAKLVRCCAGPE